MKNLHRSLVIGCSALALAGCGADDIASPGGTGVVINQPATPAPTPTPGPTPTPTVSAPDICPNLTNDGSVQLTNAGTISGPTGSYRICQLPSLITKSVELPRIAGVLYGMNGRVDVGCDGGFSAPSAGSPYNSTTIGCGTLTADTGVTLSIAPGVILIGQTGQSWLAVNRGNKINAVGTADKPIIFTSQDNVAGFNTESTQGGQWGGVVLLGRGKVTDCNVGTVASNTCERDTEGAVNLARFGGNDDTYNAGRMSYVQIRYSGFVLSNNKELQALTAEAVGSGTTLDHIQSHRSSDDGAEFFGGNFNLKYYIATAADDDSLDVDTGARVNIQYALLLQKPGEGDALFEIDSNGNEGDTPRTNLKVVNFTAYQPDVSSNNEGNDKASALFRGNADVTLYNGLIVTPNNECVRMTSNTSAANRATLTARSVGLECSGSGSAKFIGDGSGTAFTAADVAGFFTGSASNDIDLTGALMNVFVNSATADAVATTDPTTLASSFFSAAPTPYHIGAAWSGNTSWAAGWTCNSSYAPLGGLTDCTTLPVY
ncbi:MAG: hypothetical protein CL807_09130 [Citromicrobium sp.]|nr:hypothetical protein [Citromicrobium sp.]MAO94907.1 hypothetical protein [Citromicrobium sp.]MAO96684.1 hypothetical protein [Citromicrobium sp.]MBD77030.1 hypothetical protein [Citromicrobium sp.]MBT47549.1 hypothetical protein [Citromicrobium sp.]